MKCFACPGPYHPATGHIVAPGVHYCGPCARHWLAFIKQHTRRKWGGADFYAEALTSVRAGRSSEQGPPG